MRFLLVDQVLACPPTGPVRGMGVHKGTLYVVSGVVLYSVASDGTYTKLGVIPGTRRVATLEQNAAAADIVLTPEDLARVQTAYAALHQSGGLSGDR